MNDTTHAPLEQALIRLSDGHVMPQLGLGVFKVPDDEAATLVSDAISAGYRAIDTASIYRNEAGVGRGLAAAGAEAEQVFIATKVWKDDQGHDKTLAACEASLKKLGVDHIDLYLIHWPHPQLDLYVDTWRALIELREWGVVRSIGVSNFRPEHLDRIIGETGVKPVLNQIELHPRWQQRDVLGYHDQQDILIESWSPLGRGDCLSDPVIVRIAEKHGCTPAQAVIRWHLDQGWIVIPKAADRGHMVENLSVGGFRLDAGDMAAIAELDSPHGRIGPDPLEF